MLCTSVVHNVHAALNVSIVHLNKAYNTTLRFDTNPFHTNHALYLFDILPYFKSSHLVPRLSLEVVTNICVTIQVHHVMPRQVSIGFVHVFEDDINLFHLVLERKEFYLVHHVMIRLLYHKICTYQGK
jgi:hypothetical protein